MVDGFVRWILRTSDIGAARSFYEGLLEEGAPDVIELPANLRARGAPPHWLGYLASADLDWTIEAFVARGAIRLGTGELLRDPGGAVLALTLPQAKSRRDVVWKLLLTADPGRAKRAYNELFEMKMGERFEVPGHGTFDQFGWGVEEPSGAISDIAGKPHIHPQWLFFFRVAELERAMFRVRETNGSVIGPIVLPDGRCLAICEDPQGAQFGLMTDRVRE
jgi:predicted enzyme related to lactoylglutathione lyase